MNTLKALYQAEFVFDPVEDLRRLEIKAHGIQGSGRFTTPLKIIIENILRNFSRYETLRELATQADSIDRVVIAVELLSEDVDESSIRAGLGQLLELLVVSIPDRRDTLVHPVQVESRARYRFSVTMHKESCIILNNSITELTVNGIRAGMEDKFERSGKARDRLTLLSEQIQVLSLADLIKLAEDDPAKREQIREALQAADRELEAQANSVITAIEPGKSIPDVPTLIAEGSRLLERFARRNEPSVQEFQTYLDLLAQTKFKSESRDSDARNLVLEQRKAVVDGVKQLRALIGVTLFLDEQGQPAHEVVNIDCSQKGSFRFRGFSNAQIHEKASWPKIKAVLNVDINQAQSEGQSESSWRGKFDKQRRSGFTSLY